MARFNRSMAVGLLAGVGIFGLSTTAFAQDKPAAGAEGTGLDEIVVTANKREENLQKTPIAITAISAEQLDLRQLSEAKDLGSIAPNLAVVGATTNATASVISIRGIPTAADETQGFDSPIGMYVDGVYLARSSASTFDVADIERVEVLRGPQGTLFGRNTTGGAINFVTKMPSKDASLAARLGYGNYSALNMRLVANSGDMGPMRVTLSYMRKERKGTVDNLLQPDDKQDPGAYRTDAARFALHFDLGSDISLYNVFDFSKIVMAPSVSQLIAVGDGTVRPNVTLNGFTFAPVQPANVQAILNQSTVVEPGCDKTVTRAYRDSICNQSAGLSTDKLWGDMLRLEGNFGGVTVRSTTAYREWDNQILGSDLDGLGTLRGPAVGPSSTTLNGFPVSTLSLFQSPGTAAFLASQPVFSTTGGFFTAANDRRQSQFSQELEIVSKDSDTLQWVLGAFYFKEKGHERNVQNIGFALDTNAAIFNSTNFGQLAPLLQANNPARYRLALSNSILEYDSRGESVAVYGQATYRPGGKDGPLGITLGLRNSWDTKDVVRQQNGGLPYTAAADIAFNTGHDKFQALTGNLTLDYRASEDINLYARIARGYRSGGFNLRQATHDGATAVPPFGNRTLPLTSFKPEKLWSYELGAKMQFNNRIRLNVAAFHNVYTDQLATVPVPIVGSGSFGTITVNAGKTTYTGFEAEGMFKVSDNFSIDANLGYIDIKIKEFPGADTTNTVRNIAPLIAGQGYAPKWTGSIAGNLTVPISEETKMVARVGYNYASSFEMFPNTLTAPFQVQTRGDSRGLLDGQLRLSTKSGSMPVSLTLWGKNLTNQHYITRTVDFGQLGLATGIYGEPRTFGVTFDIEF